MSDSKTITLVRATGPWATMSSRVVCLLSARDETEQTQKTGETPETPSPIVIVLVVIILRLTLGGLHGGCLGHHRRLRFCGDHSGSREESGGQKSTDSHATHSSSLNNP